MHKLYDTLWYEIIYTFDFAVTDVLRLHWYLTNYLLDYIECLRHREYFMYRST